MNERAFHCTVNFLWPHQYQFCGRTIVPIEVSTVVETKPEEAGKIAKISYVPKGAKPHYARVRLSSDGCLHIGELFYSPSLDDPEATKDDYYGMAMQILGKLVKQVEILDKPDVDNPDFLEAASTLRSEEE